MKTPGQTVTVSVVIQTGHLLNKILLPDWKDTANKAV